MTDSILVYSTCRLLYIDALLNMKKQNFQLYETQPKNLIENKKQTGVEKDLYLHS